MFFLKSSNSNYNHGNVYTQKISSARGNIYDRHGRLLAGTIVFDYIRVNPRKVADKEKLIDRLSEVLNIPKNKIINAWKGNSIFPVFKGHIKSEVIGTLRKNEGGKFNGVLYEKVYERFYPENDLCAHLIGMTNHDGIGISGIELKFNKELTERGGIEEYFVDGKGKEVVRKINSKSDRGCDIYLTIDKTIQMFLEKELEDALHTYKAKRVMGVIQDSTNGEIIAMALKPSFNPNVGVKDIKELRNPFVEEVFEFGSLIKVLPMAIAIEEKIFGGNEVINCENGEWIYSGRKIKDHKKSTKLVLSGVMAYSSNIGMAKIGLKVGYKRMYEYFKKVFGLNCLTGIDLPGEVRGEIRSPDSPLVSIYTPVMVSLGYEISLTPIQVLSIYSAISNGGTLYQPYVVKCIKKGEDVIYQASPRVMKKKLSSRTIAEIKKMLYEVTLYGTGVKANVPGYKVGGKTGTAEKLNPVTGEYSSTRHISSFCGFIPFDEPKFTILVIVDEPKGVFWASETAAPLFSRIAKRIMDYHEAKNYAKAN